MTTVRLCCCRTFLQQGISQQNAQCVDLSLSEWEPADVWLLSNERFFLLISKAVHFIKTNALFNQKGRLEYHVRGRYLDTTGVRIHSSVRVRLG